MTNGPVKRGTMEEFTGIPWVNLPNSLSDLRMPTHTQVVIAAPHTDVFLAARVLLSKGEATGLSLHLLEDPVGMVLFLLLYLTHKEPLVVEQVLWQV